MSLNFLKNEIEHSRMEMVQLALKKSLSDQSVIEVSERLDSLINLYNEYGNYPSENKYKSS